MELALLDGLGEAVRQGLDTDNGNFKAKGWAIAVQRVRATTTQNIQAQGCKYKFTSWKRVWSDWGQFEKGISGWGWNEELGTFQSDKETMDEFFSAKAHKNFLQFRFKGPPYRSRLAELLGGSVSSLSLYSPHLELIY